MTPSQPERSDGAECPWCRASVQLENEHKLPFHMRRSRPTYPCPMSGTPIDVAEDYALDELARHAATGE